MTILAVTHFPPGFTNLLYFLGGCVITYAIMAGTTLLSERTPDEITRDESDAD